MNLQSGYIALLSAIILSFVLLIISASLSAISFSLRAQALLQEEKQQSWYFARACAESAVIKTAENNGSTPPNERISIGLGNCIINSIQVNVPAIGNATIITESKQGNAETHLKTVIQVSSLGIISQQEQ